MKQLETGFLLPRDNTPIRYGDIIGGKHIVKSVVKYHDKFKVPIVELQEFLDRPIYFTLEEIIRAWGKSLRIDGNILIYIER